MGWGVSFGLVLVLVWGVLGLGVPCFLKALFVCFLELSFSIVLGAFINTLLFFVCFCIVLKDTFGVLHDVAGSFCVLISLTCPWCCLEVYLPNLWRRSRCSLPS